MDGYQRQSAVTIQTGIKLIEQIHLIPFRSQSLLDSASDIQIDIRFGQRDLPVVVNASGPRVVACMPGDDPNAQLGLWRGHKVIFRLSGQDETQFIGKTACEQAFGGSPQVEQCRQEHRQSKRTAKDPYRAWTIASGRAGRRRFHEFRIIVPQQTAK